MPFDRPSLAELVAQTQQDFAARSGLSDPLRRADVAVHARVAAGVAHGLYGALDWYARQILPDTADAEYLDRWASIWLQVPRKAAAAASGVVAFVVQAGAVIPAGTQVRALDGQVYATTAAASGVVPAFTAPVQAVGAGAAGNRTSGQAMQLVSPVAGVQPAVVAGEMSGGADIEADDALRARLLDAIRRPAQGGSAADYVAWALEVPGVTRAWCYPGELGPRSVTVRFVRDNDASIIPDAAEVAAVQAYINQRRPVTDQLTVVAPTLLPVALTIAGLSPNTSAVQAAVSAELADLFRREAKPGGAVLLSHIRAAISAAAGEDDYTLTSPTANVVATTGQMLTRGVITWV
jgi:uncharacterized phage protein gp47/JayE